MTTDVLLEDAANALHNDMAGTLTRISALLQGASNWESWDWEKFTDAEKYAILRVSEQLLNLLRR